MNDDLKQLLKGEDPVVLETLRAADQNQSPEHAGADALKVARLIRELRDEHAADRLRRESLFSMIEDQVRAACRQEIEDAADDWVTAREVRTIVHDMVANDDITVPVDGLASQVRTVIEEMVGDGELTVDTEVSSYVMLN